MSKKYEEELDKTLIEISDEEVEEETEDILPFIEELKEKISKDSLSAEIKNIYDQMRSKLISVLRKKVS